MDPGVLLLHLDLPRPPALHGHQEAEAAPHGLVGGLRQRPHPPRLRHDRLRHPPPLIPLPPPPGQPLPPGSISHHAPAV